MTPISSSLVVAILTTLTLPVCLADLSIPAGSLVNDDIRECDSLHPDLIAGTYSHSTDPRPGLSKTEAASEHAMLHAFYSKLEGKWEGHQIDRVCFGTGDTARQESRFFLHKRMQGAFRHDGLFTFRSEKHRVEAPEKGRSPRTISLKPDYRLDFYPADELQDLQLIDQNTIVMTKRYHQANTYDFTATTQQGPLLNNTDGVSHLACQQSVTLSSDGVGSENITDVCMRDNNVRHTTARERIDAIMIDGTQAYVQTHYYTNGHYSGTETMQLKRVH